MALVSGPGVHARDLGCCPHVGCKQAVRQLDEGGLAAAVGAKQAHDAAKADVQLDVIEGGLSPSGSISSVPSQLKSSLHFNHSPLFPSPFHKLCGRLRGTVADAAHLLQIFGGHGVRAVSSRSCSNKGCIFGNDSGP